MLIGIGERYDAIVSLDSSRSSRSQKGSTRWVEPWSGLQPEPHRATHCDKHLPRRNRHDDHAVLPDLNLPKVARKRLS